MVADYDSVVVGLGKVGLATAIALAFAGSRVHAVGASARRLHEIVTDPDELCTIQRAQLRKVLARGRLTLSEDPKALERARSVVVCESTTPGERATHEETMLREACATVVRAARRGQVLVLTSIPFVGATEELLVAPLRRRGLTVGEDVNVCFSPDHVVHGPGPVVPELTPRVIGGATPACVRAGSEAIAGTCAGTQVADCLAAVEIAELVQRGQLSAGQLPGRVSG